MYPPNFIGAECACHSLSTSHFNMTADTAEGTLFCSCFGAQGGTLLPPLPPVCIAKECHHPFQRFAQRMWKAFWSDRPFLRQQFEQMGFHMRHGRSTVCFCKLLCVQSYCVPSKAKLNPCICVYTRANWYMKIYHGDAHTRTLLLHRDIHDTWKVVEDSDREGALLHWSGKDIRRLVDLCGRTSRSLMHVCGDADGIISHDVHDYMIGPCHARRNDAPPTEMDPHLAPVPSLTLSFSDGCQGLDLDGDDYLF